MAGQGCFAEKGWSFYSSSILILFYSKIIFLILMLLFHVHLLGPEGKVR